MATRIQAADKTPHGAGAPESNVATQMELAAIQTPCRRRLPRAMSYSHTSSNDSSELPAPIPPVRDAAAAIPTGKGKYDSHRKRDTDFRKDMANSSRTSLKLSRSSAGKRISLKLHCKTTATAGKP